MLKRFCGTGCPTGPIMLEAQRRASGRYSAARRNHHVREAHRPRDGSGPTRQPGMHRGGSGCRLKLAANTVDNHKSRAMAKLGTDKAALLTRIALKMRITSMKDKLTAAEKRRSGRKKDGWN